MSSIYFHNPSSFIIKVMAFFYCLHLVNFIITKCFIFSPNIKFQALPFAPHFHSRRSNRWSKNHLTAIKNILQKHLLWWTTRHIQTWLIHLTQFLCVTKTQSFVITVVLRRYPSRIFIILFFTTFFFIKKVCLLKKSFQNALKLFQKDVAKIKYR